MIESILFTIAMLIYWFSEGCTEGYTWASKEKRKTNILIFGGVKNGQRSGMGLLDYHAWRLGENIGMVGSIFSAFLFSNFWSLLFVFTGSWMLGYFIYERALNYICYKDMFPQKGPWGMMGIEIKRSNIFDCLIALIGITIIIIGVING